MIELWIAQLIFNQSASKVFKRENYFEIFEKKNLL